MSDACVPPAAVWMPAGSFSGSVLLWAQLNPTSSERPGALAGWECCARDKPALDPDL